MREETIRPCLYLQALLTVTVTLPSDVTARALRPGGIANALSRTMAPDDGCISRKSMSSPVGVADPVNLLLAQGEHQARYMPVNVDDRVGADIAFVNDHDPPARRREAVRLTVLRRIRDR